MKQLQSLSHTVWECKYHIVWIPKYRKKVLYGKIREELVGVFHELANRRGCKILEGHLCVDHVHMLLSIPPKYGVAEVVGYLKGKSAIEIAKHFEKVCKITGASFWASNSSKPSLWKTDTNAVLIFFVSAIELINYNL